MLWQVLAVVVVVFPLAASPLAWAERVGLPLLLYASVWAGPGLGQALVVEDRARHARRGRAWPALRWLGLVD